jgi:RNA polymerase sigma factor (sigma-70 family)
MKPEEALRTFKRLIIRLAREYVEDGLDIEDLLQEAKLAVLENVSNYEEGVTRAPLKLYLRHRIRDRLRIYKAKMLDRIEVDRYWEAVCIADHDKSIRAKTKGDCERQRQAAGEHLFARPRRVEEMVGNVISLDEELFVDADGEPITRHDVIGAPPGQEAVYQAKHESKRRLHKMAQEAAARTKFGSSCWSEIDRLRSEGLTFAEIGIQLNKSTDAVKKAWQRSQKRLGQDVA